MQAQNASQDTKNFNISFCWNGMKTEYNSELRFGSVELKGLDTQTLISIPDSPSGMKNLKFQVKAASSIFSYECDSIKITLDQLRRLRVIAGILEKSPIAGPRVMDSRTGIITSQERMLRSDRQLKLEIPPELEYGQSYTIVCTNNGAKLIRSDNLLTFETLREKIIAIYSSFKTQSDIDRASGELFGNLILNPFAELERIAEEAKNYKPQIHEILNPSFMLSVMLAHTLVAHKNELETDLVFRVGEKIKEGNLKTALVISRKIENPEKRANALSITIRGYINHRDAYDSETAWDLIREMPDGSYKDELTTDLFNFENPQVSNQESHLENEFLNEEEVIDLEIHIRNHFHDPVTAWGKIARVKNEELRAKLTADLKSYEASQNVSENDLDISSLFEVTPIPALTK